MTQQELAVRARTALRTIQNLESGTSSGHMSTWDRIAAALDTDVDSLLGIRSRRATG